jgi:hypothetical protein
MLAFFELFTPTCACLSSNFDVAAFFDSRQTNQGLKLLSAHYYCIAEHVVSGLIRQYKGVSEGWFPQINFRFRIANLLYIESKLRRKNPLPQNRVRMVDFPD